MPGLSSGVPNTRDYVLGRGIVRLASLTAAGLPDTNGFRDLGNAPEFSVTVEVEDLRHQSSREITKFTDKRFVISQEVSLAFQLDEINFDNLAAFLSGDAQTYDNTAIESTIAATAAHIVDGSSTPFAHSRWYQIFAETAHTTRIYNLGAAGLVYTIVRDPAGAADVLVEDDDYEIDEEMGLIRFIEGGTNTVVTSDIIGLAIGTAATAPSTAVLEVAALQQSSVEGALLFVQLNAGDQGNKTEYLFHKVTLSADGDLSMIGDEVQTMGFTGVAERNNAVSDTSKVLTVRTFDQQA